MKQAWLQRLMLLGLALMLVGGYVVWRNLRLGPLPAGELKTVTEFQERRPLPAFRLSGSHGEFGNAQLQGRWTFLFFGYTQCPDICPTALTLMKSVKAAVPSVTEGNPHGTPTFQVVFVSVDPVRDTPELLKNYMAAFDPEFIGLSGDDAALVPLTKDLGVFYQRNDTTDKKNYTVDHSAAIYLINPAGQLAALFSPPQDAGRMIADYKRITAK